MGRPSCKTEALERLGDHSPAWGSGEPWTLRGRGGDSLLAEGGLAMLCAGWSGVTRDGDRLGGDSERGGRARGWCPGSAGPGVALSGAVALCRRAPWE